MKTIGSQKRETLKEAGYKIVKEFRDDLVVTTKTGRLELWTKSNSFANYVMVYKGIGYEFVTTNSIIIEGYLE